MVEERRCRDGDITLASSSPFHTHFEVRTTFPLSECLHNRFFMNVGRGRFQVGDRVNIVRYNNDTWKEVLEIVEGVRIVTNDPEGMELLVTFAPINLRAPKEEGVVVARGFRGRFPIRIDGAVEREYDNIVEANEYAERRGKELNKPVQLYDSKKKAA